MTRGLISYFEVVDAEQDLLRSQRVEAQIKAERFVAGIALIRALGGGWEESLLKGFDAGEPSVPDTVSITTGGF